MNKYQLAFLITLATWATLLVGSVAVNPNYATPTITGFAVGVILMAFFRWRNWI